MVESKSKDIDLFQIKFDLQKLLGLHIYKGKLSSMEHQDLHTIKGMRNSYYYDSSVQICDRHFIRLDQLMEESVNDQTQYLKWVLNPYVHYGILLKREIIYQISNSSLLTIHFIFIIMLYATS